MIRTGDVLVNPVTGEQLRFVKTARDTDGRSIELEVTVEPHGSVAAAHMHPRQTERFEIVSGTVGFRIGRKTIEAHAGDAVVVEPGTAHKFWNAGEEQAVFRTVISPALSFERLIETMFALAADGKPLASIQRLIRTARAGGVGDEGLYRILDLRIGLTGRRRVVDELRDGNEAPALRALASASG
jgi:mannose-6-phosphate isomerase-like protein (cupin superfamily)